MGRIRCVLCKKIPTWLCGTNFCSYCTSSPRFAPSFMQLRNDPKCKHYAPHPNMSLGSNGVDWVHSLQKLPTWLHGTNFCINCTSSPCFASIFICYETIPNAPKYYVSQQNMSLGSSGVDWVRSLRKIPTWLRGTKFCIICTSSHCFAPSSM